MEKFKLYKDMDVSYWEVEKVLGQLGFRNCSNSGSFYYVQDDYKAFFKMPMKSGSEKVLETDLKANAYGIWVTGVVRDINDFLKLIERKRLASGVQVQTQ